LIQSTLTLDFEVGVAFDPPSREVQGEA
jgi:hypothetical protein